MGKETAKNSNYLIVQLPDGKYEIQGEEPAEGPKGPFDKIYSHGNLKHLIGIIPENDRFNSSNLPSGEVLSFNNHPFNQIDQNINNISTLANHSSPDNPDNRLSYQKNLFSIFSELTTKIKEGLEKEGTLDRKKYIIIPPQKGGEIVAAFIVYSAKQIGWEIPFENIAYVEEKRIRMDDGNMFLGINLKYLPPIDLNTSFVFADDCLATNISTKSCLQLIGEKLHLPIEKIKSTAVYAVAHQESMQELFNELGTHVITGGLAFELDKTFYIKNPNDLENPFKVGDMGEWTKILPKEFNSRAPWNKIRLNLRNFWNS